MKQFTTILLIALWPFLSNADSKKTAEMRVANNLVGEIFVQIDSLDQELPRVWDDFESIGMMKKGSMKHQLFRAKIINSFALVPGAPVIESQPGISREYRGHRLFLISREENLTKSQGSGRYAILVKPEEMDSKPIRIFSQFIPEDIAKLILNKIPDFNPAHQPLAFEDLSPFEREQQQYHDNVRLPDRQNQDKEALGERPLKNDRSSNSTSFNKTKELKMWAVASKWYIAGFIGLLTLAIIFWQRARKRGAKRGQTEN